MIFYASVEICSTPPFLPPSLKGKGKSTLPICSTYLLFINEKSASEDRTCISSKAVLICISMAVPLGLLNPLVMIMD